MDNIFPIFIVFRNVCIATYATWMVFWIDRDCDIAFIKILKYNSIVEFFGAFLFKLAAFFRGMSLMKSCTLMSNTTWTLMRLFATSILSELEIINDLEIKRKLELSMVAAFAYLKDFRLGFMLVGSVLSFLSLSFVDPPLLLSLNSIIFNPGRFFNILL